MFGLGLGLNKTNQGGQGTPTTDNRVTQAADQRTTQAGDNRITIPLP